MHQSSHQSMRDFRDRRLGSLLDTPLRIFDLGSQNINGSYRDLFDRPAWSYVGLDLTPGPGVDLVLAKPYRWSELASGCCDVLVSGQALEHIEYFWATALEIERVLRPGGLVCLIAPSAGHEHRFPVDCHRYYPDGFASLARYAGLTVLEIDRADPPSSLYDDGSQEWKDLRLIARKDRRPLAERLLRRTCALAQAVFLEKLAGPASDRSERGD